MDKLIEQTSGVSQALENLANIALLEKEQERLVKTNMCYLQKNVTMRQDAWWQMSSITGILILNELREIKKILENKKQ